MTILVDVAVIGMGVLVGRWVARSFRGRREPMRSGEPEGSEPSSTPAGPPFAGLPCALGDVVVRSARHDEAWLAGALVFDEASPVAVLFIAPEAGGDRGIYLRHAAPAELSWLSVVPLAELALPADLPHVLEREGVRYSRARRLPVRVRRLGTGAPEVGDEAILGDYTAGDGGRLVVVVGKERTLAWAGESVAADEVDVLPGGEATGG